MYQQIMVAVDFSLYPEWTFQFGLDLSPLPDKSNVSLVYVFHPQQVKGRLRADKDPVLLKKHFQKKLHQLQPPSNLTGKNQGVEFSKLQREVLQGNPAEELIKLSANPEVQVVVINRSAYSYPFTKDFSEVVANFTHDGHCMIILTSQNLQNQGFQKILMVNDCSGPTEESAVLLERISATAYLFNADVYFLHVIPEVNENSTDLQETLQQNFIAMGPDQQFQYSTTSPGNILSAINGMLAANDIHLLHFISNSRDFWPYFLKNQMEENYLLNKQIPIAISHVEY